MAKLVLTVDTDTQEMVTTLNGEVLADVSNVNAYSYGKPGEKHYEVHFEACGYSSDSDVSKHTRLYASETPEAKKAREDEPKSKYTKAQSEIIAMYKNRVGR